DGYHHRPLRDRHPPMIARCRRVQPAPQPSVAQNALRVGYEPASAAGRSAHAAVLPVRAGATPPATVARPTRSRWCSGLADGCARPPGSVTPTPGPSHWVVYEGPKFYRLLEVFDN